MGYEAKTGKMAREEKLEFRDFSRYLRVLLTRFFTDRISRYKGSVRKLASGGTTSTGGQLFRS